MIEKKTAYKGIFSYFQLRGHTGFLPGSMLLSLTRWILGHPLSVKITGKTKAPIGLNVEGDY